MKKISNEFKVGLFVILCIAGFFYLIYSTGKLNIKKDGYNIYVVFNEAAGIAEKSPVMLNGLEVGKVDTINLCYDNDKTEIILKLWIDSKAKIRQNPEVSIKMMGLMGEKYIQIKSIAGEDFLQPGTIIAGKPFVDLDSLMANINGTLEENRGDICDIVKNLEATSKNFEEFSADIKRNPWKVLFKTKEKPAKP